ncbi:MAG: hypothetical protein CL910_01665 [Deltaproteobacteria bacterium]|nr:hypothetical protein [Deltaproteobacteria bacterium]
MTVWFNTDKYTPLELSVVGVGCLVWVLVYAIVVFRIVRFKYVEIPAAAVAANIAWEFLWGFVWGTDIGMAVTWMYRLGCLLDVFILAMLFRYGALQVSTPAIRQAFKPALVAATLVWTLAVATYVNQGYDNGYGGLSGYIISAQLTSLYLFLFLKSEMRLFSYAVAWLRFAGDTAISAFNVMVAHDNHFLMVLLAITFVFDVLYVVAFTRRRRAEPGG